MTGTNATGFHLGIKRRWEIGRYGNRGDKEIWELE
jgi:hypothetical protein